MNNEWMCSKLNIYSYICNVLNENLFKFAADVAAESEINFATLLREEFWYYNNIYLL